jgi:uncharacterized protein YqeY
VIARIEDEIKTAMRARDSERRDALRLLLSALRSAEKDARKELDDEALLAVLRRERKRRVEAAEAFHAAGSQERAAHEEREAAIIDEFLPAALSDEELSGIVDAAIEKTGATSMKDMGGVMREAMAASGGRADGKRVQTLVREKLSG